MKTTNIFLALFVISLSACSTTSSYIKGDASDRAPETMLVTYQVKSGQEAEFEKTLAEAWQIFRHEQMVFAQPHVIVREKQSDGKTKFIETFTWLSHYAPDHAPKSVTTIWAKEQSLCEKRDGHEGIDGNEVDPVLPKPR